MPRSKRAKRAYFAKRREEWNAFLQKASKITNLSFSSLRQYEHVVRNGAKVDGLLFSHHLEVQRCRESFHDERGKKKTRFAYYAALSILELAKEKGWTVRETREEVQRQFPARKKIISVQKAICLVMDAIKHLELVEQVQILDTLSAEILVKKNRIESEMAPKTMAAAAGDDPDF
ncbi:MAG: hypothetical protein WBW53_06100 [Terriglobales bacterium]